MSSAGPASDRVPLASVVGVAAAAGLVPLNSTMIAVALPAIADDFEVSTGVVGILVTLYLAVMLIGQPLAGRAADRWGSRRTVQGALVGLAACSAAAAVAPAFAVLVGARALQAVCAAALGPATQSLLAAMAPPDERGRVFGIMGSVMGAGAASGPIVGGALVAAFGWQAIFVVNVPVALGAIAATRRADGAAATPGSSRPAVPDTGARIANGVFVASFCSQALCTGAQYALLILTPIILHAQGWGSSGIGLVLSTLTIGMIVAGPVGGRIGDARGQRLPALVGLAAAAAAIVALAAAGSDVTPVLLAIGLTVFGIGLGVVMPNLTSAALGSVPPARTGAAAGVFSMGRYVGSIASTTLIVVIVTEAARGATTVLVTAAAATVLATAAAARLPAGPPRPARRPAAHEQAPAARGAELG